MVPATDPPRDAQASIDYPAVQNSEQFRELRKTHRSFAFPLAVAFLVWYFAYVLLADYAHDVMSTPVIGNINLGVILGLAQFVTTFGITMWYVSYANRKLDPRATSIREDLEERERAAQVEVDS
ncbi:DUF485 domain-containing protein [Paramicrobacterium fandaimingii]|uniref:DUF485 domain-containing protein n=1 Tax=Paramicrobacterium fandaimingii TaxID=2708079 RepID=UPI00141FFCB1|nr:DUF485 domain-containing protein [Microbacterium fandaimingii]